MSIHEGPASSWEEVFTLCVLRFGPVAAVDQSVFDVVNYPMKYDIIKFPKVASIKRSATLVSGATSPAPFEPL